MMQRGRNPWLMRLLRGKWAEETQPCTLGATPKRGSSAPVSTTPQLREARPNESEGGSRPFSLLDARRQAGFSLGELLAVVIIGSMILVAILTIYGRATQAADAVLRKIDAPAWTSEVLQLIAEDLGRALGADDVTVQIRNGSDNGFQRAELVVRRTYHDSENKEQTLDQITWRAGYDHEGRTPGLVIYRSYEGVAQEDKLLDDNRDEVEKFSPFVPVCRGVTFFQIQACKGADLIDQWPASPPPSGVKVTISFGTPHDMVRGGFDVDEQDKISRTVVIDPMRKIAFAMAGRADANSVPDPNAAPSDQQSTKGPSSKGKPPQV